MEIYLIIIGIAILTSLIILIIKLFSRKDTEITTQQQILLDTQKESREQLNQIMRTINENLNSTQGNFDTQFKTNHEVISEIHNKLGSLEATTKNIQEIGKDISSLQEILSAPKLRGNLGEYLLEELLRDILPSQNFKTQYTFKNGTKVDAIIRLADGIVPIDSKFPLESFQRLVAAESEEEKKIYKKEFISSVKKRIEEIASKYINPTENTFDFAMMYIPAENVFYETIINDSLTNTDYEIFNYAWKNHVIPVSPNSFYAYLMSIAYGLKGLKIEQQAKVMVGELAKIQSSFEKFYSEFGSLGEKIKIVGKKYDELTKKADKINDQVGKITGIKNELPGPDEAEQLDNPN